MAKRIPVKRDEELRIKISKEMKERLIRVADLMGCPPGTCGAIAVGHWVTSQEIFFSEVVPALEDDAAKQAALQQVRLFPKEPKLF